MESFGLLQVIAVTAENGAMKHKAYTIEVDNIKLRYTSSGTLVIYQNDDVGDDSVVFSKAGVAALKAFLEALNG